MFCPIAKLIDKFLKILFKGEKYSSMTLQDIISEIKLELTGNLLETEIDDTTLIQVVNKALRELERFWDESCFITVPFASCIDMSDFNSTTVVGVYRPMSRGESEQNVNTMTDPLYAQQWMIFSNGGTMYNLNDYVLNYASWSTLSQIKNTMSIDLSFTEDKHNRKLYINRGSSALTNVTIEYVPKLMKVEDIQSDYWIDILVRLSVALTKIILGRIRTRFSQNNALWGMDGDKLLEEGNTEYKDLRETLRVNANMLVFVD